MPQWTTFDAHAWRDAVATASAKEGVEAALAEIDRADGTLNAFSVVLRDSARKQAIQLDQLDPSARGPLHGVPVAIKEELDVQGAPTTFGTRANPTVKTADSEVVARLREAGAIIIGKTNMPEFGAYPYTSSRGYGVTRNPLNPEVTPGGSSGGSAAAVAAGMVPIAMGGDGGGSIRIPAAACGLVGLKPTRGALPTDPYPDLWKSLGTSGPITKSVRDARLMFSVLSTPRPFTGSFSDANPSDTLSAPGSWRIAVMTKPVNPLAKVHTDNLTATLKTADRFAAMGCDVVELDDHLPDPTLPFLALMFGGIREEIAGLEHPDRIEPRHKLTNLLGAWSTPAVQQWAQAKAEEIGTAVDKLMVKRGIKAILTPTVAGRPARADILTGKGPIRASLSSIGPIAFTAMWNVGGQPAIAVSDGMGSDGLPTSSQLVGARGTEGLLLEMAQRINSAG